MACTAGLVEAITAMKPDTFDTVIEDLGITKDNPDVILWTTAGKFSGSLLFVKGSAVRHGAITVVSGPLLNPAQNAIDLDSVKALANMTGSHRNCPSRHDLTEWKKLLRSLIQRRSSRKRAS